MDNYRKYLKYKYKYLKLKQLLGGIMGNTQSELSYLRIKLFNRNIQSDELWCFDIDHTIKSDEDIEYILDKLKNRNWGMVTARWLANSDKRLKEGSFYAYGRPNISFTRMAKHKVAQIIKLKEKYNAKKIYFFDNNRKNCFYVKKKFGEIACVYLIKKKSKLGDQTIRLKKEKVKVKVAPNIIVALDNILKNN